MLLGASLGVSLGPALGVALGLEDGDPLGVTLGWELGALLGLALGVFFGWILTAYLAVVGFAYPGMDELMVRFNMPGRMYPEVSLLSLLWGPAVVMLGAMIAAIYPALRLFRLAPVQAMRAV